MPYRLANGHFILTIISYLALKIYQSVFIFFIQSHFLKLSAHLGHILKSSIRILKTELSMPTLLLYRIIKGFLIFLPHLSHLIIYYISPCIFLILPWCIQNNPYILCDNQSYMRTSLNQFPIQLLQYSSSFSICITSFLWMLAACYNPWHKPLLLKI